MDPAHKFRRMDNLKITDLKKIAKAVRLKGYGKMTKYQLVSGLSSEKREEVMVYFTEEYRQEQAKIQAIWKSIGDRYEQQQREKDAENDRSKLTEKIVHVVRVSEDNNPNNCRGSDYYDYGDIDDKEAVREFVFTLKDGSKQRLEITLTNTQWNDLDNEFMERPVQQRKEIKSLYELALAASRMLDVDAITTDEIPKSILRDIKAYGFAIGPITFVNNTNVYFKDDDVIFVAPLNKCDSTIFCS